MMARDQRAWESRKCAKSGGDTRAAECLACRDDKRLRRSGETPASAMTKGSDSASERCRGHARFQEAAAVRTFVVVDGRCSVNQQAPIARLESRTRITGGARPAVPGPRSCEHGKSDLRTEAGSAMPAGKQLATPWIVDSRSCLDLAGSATLLDARCSVKQVPPHKFATANGRNEVSEEASIRVAERAILGQALNDEGVRVQM